MQKEYIEPEIELIKFTVEDIITTSDDILTTDDDEGPILPPDPSETTDPTGPVSTDPVPTRDPDEGVIV